MNIPFPVESGETIPGPGLIVLYFFTLFFFSRYKITREQHQETLAELDRRRLEAAPAIDRAS